MDELSMRRAIERKRDGEPLEAEVWEEIIAGCVSGKVGDAQMAALAMACVWRGLHEDEAVALTSAMVASGATLRYPEGMFVVDKHSSGGVSDIVSLVAVPLVAACGVRVAKLSGRALGHTGGTIDKLEAIEGFDATPSMEAFVRQVERIGCAIAAQTDDFVPADKRLYHLRDHTATVPSMGLIAASIVSKKVAGGAHAFVFDVKCGSAAFMRDATQADALAKLLVRISEKFGRKAHAVVSDMNEPLGRFIGTGVEVVEARELLRGNEHDERALDACLQIAASMLDLGGVASARERALHALESGNAYAKFVEMVEAQGGSRAALEALAPDARGDEVRATSEGTVTAIDAVALGNIARALTKNNPRAGLRVAVRIGEYVASSTVLAETFGEGSDPQSVAAAFKIA